MFCKKCGEVIPAGADFCMSCGAKVEANDKKEIQKEKAEQKSVPNFSGIINKESAFHVENKPDFSKTQNNKVDSTQEEKANKKPKTINIGKLHIKKKIVVITILVAIGLLLAGGIGYYAFTELTPQGQYLKGVQVYNYLCNYRSSNNDLNNYTVDDECLKKLEEGRDYFEKAGDLDDAKLFYYSFKAYANLVKTNGNWESSTSDVFLKQAVADITSCLDKKLVPNTDDFSPETQSQKLYMYVRANLYMAVAGSVRDIQGIRLGYNMFDTLREANNGPYWFCGKDTDSLQDGLDFLLFKYGA